MTEIGDTIRVKSRRGKYKVTRFIPGDDGEIIGVVTIAMTGRFAGQTRRFRLEDIR